MPKPRPIGVQFAHQVGAKVCHQLQMLLPAQLRDVGIIYSRRYAEWRDGNTQTQYLVRFVSVQGSISDPVWLYGFQIKEIE